MDVTVTKEYKDRLFRLVFQDKKDLLSLYNAVNKSSYENPEELQILTLENMIYLKMKNDISFLLGDILNLYEHQSTDNPNMPVRELRCSCLILIWDGTGNSWKAAVS